MKKATILTLICLLVLTLVACDPTVEGPVDNMTPTDDVPVDNMKTAEEWGLDVNSPTTYKRPFAQSDPNNPLDQKSEAIKTMVGIESSDGRLLPYESSYGRVLFISISNSESINNLFYDYTFDDFGIREYPWKDAYTEETYVYPDGIYSFIHEGEDHCYIEEFRERLFNGEAIDLTNIKRVVSIGYSGAHLAFGEGYNGAEYPSEEEWMDMLVYISKLDFVTHISWASGWFSTTPDGYSENNSWALERINIREAWDYTMGSPNVTVGIMDSGVRITHDAIEHAHNSGLDYGQNYDSDEVNHGTMVTGIMFAEDSERGVYGVCHDAQFVSLKANDGSNYQSDPDSALERYDLVIDCLEYAEANGIPIVNFSGGFYPIQINGCGYIPEDKIDDLYNAVANYSGLLVVASGNQGYNYDNSGTTPLYPQCFDLPNILVVGASNQSDDVWTYFGYSSNYGSEFVDLFAPGKNIRTTSASSDTAIVSGQQGTSMAAPFVAGVAALLKSYDYTLTTAQIKEAILNSVTEVDGLRDKCVSGGILNAQAALEYVCRHDYDATYIDEETHSESCNLCECVEIKSHEYVYTSNNMFSHKYGCKCGYIITATEAHMFKFAGLVGGKQRVECINCGFTKLEELDVPIVSPNDLLDPLLPENTDDRYYITASKK